MREQNTHLSDETLLLLADGEIGGRQEKRLRAHLAACWSCRLRMRELEDAIAEAARLHREISNFSLPPPDGPRALLKARLRELSADNSQSDAPLSRRVRALGLVALAAGLLVALWLGARPQEHTAIPRFDLTPGAVRTVSVNDVCAANLSGNAEVVPAVQMRVFAEYGMPHAEPQAFEVDYLITPALGGSDDIRNLWPQPYAGSPWNAYVKDALEDRLREMVCNGELDLATAQHEIAVNWIAAYKKYFHTNRPLPQHLRPENRAE